MGMAKPGNNRNGKYGRVGSAKPSSSVATWEDAEPDDLWKTIIAVTNAGDALTLAKTRDGGAVALTVLDGDDRLKYYATGEAEIKTLLAEIRASAEDAE